MVKNQRGVVVAYRVVPGEPDQSIIVDTSSLMAEEHDAIIKAVQDNAGQEADEFATVMARTQLPDGSNMLARFHTTGKMMKVAVDEVEMQPDHKTVLPLSELNNLIAQQRGVTIDELAIAPNDVPKGAKATPVASMETADIGTPAANATDVLSDTDLAAQFRSQADSLYKEAKALRAQAEELVPTVKKASVVKKTKAKATSSAVG